MERLLGLEGRGEVAGSGAAEAGLAARMLMAGPVSACVSWITDSREMEAARSSGRTPPGPRLKGVGAGVAGRPVLPPLWEIRNQNII